MRYETSEQAYKLVSQILSAPPRELGGLEVQASVIKDSADRITDGVKMTGQQGELTVRVIARPSGTEPKAKFYLEVTGPAGSRENVEALYDKFEFDVINLF